MLSPVPSGMRRLGRQEERLEEDGQEWPRGRETPGESGGLRTK